MRTLHRMEKVIFDTNAYRNLVTGKTFDQIDFTVKKLKSKESRMGIQSLVSPIVLMELLSHVASKKDKSYQKCLHALKALYLHCTGDNGYRLMASPELLVANSFFHTTVPKKENSIKALMQAAYYVTQKPSDYTRRKFQNLLIEVRKFVHDTEMGFVSSIKQFVNQIDPAASDWKIFANDPSRRAKALVTLKSDNTSIAIAAGYLVVVGQMIKDNGIAIQLDEEQLYDMAKAFINVFPEFIALYKRVFESLIHNDFDMTKKSRENFIWDIQLMMNAGDHTVDGGKLYLVTNDTAMIRAAVEQNGRYTVLDINEYLAYVN